MDLISVIITTHGRLELLKKAIKSVQQQTYPNIELIVVDDCSADGTREWMQNNFNGDAIYFYIEKKDSKGGNHARNVGIKAAKGIYIAFLDDDDVWDRHKIEKQVKLMESAPNMVLAYCGHTKVYENEKSIEIIPSGEFVGDLSSKVFTMVFCTTSMVMIRKSVLEKSGLFDEALKFWQEYDLIIRICQYGTVGCVYESLVDILHSRTDPSRLSTKIDGWLEAVDYIENKYADSIHLLSAEQVKARKLMIYNDAANRCEAANDMKRHRMFLKKAWKVDGSLKHWVKYKLNITNYQMDCLRQKLKGVKK